MQRKYSRAKLVAYIVEQLNSGTQTDVLVQQVAAYLIESNKTSDLLSVMRDAQELRAQKYGEIELTTKSAHPLEQSQLAEIEQIARAQYPNAKNVTIHSEQDNSVVGGVTVTLPQASIDVSVRNKLNQLREAIS